MKVFIINTPIRTTSLNSHLSEQLGIEYLAASVRAARHAVKVWDASLVPPKPLENDTFYCGASDEEIENRIREENPDVIGISCHYAFSVQKSYDIAMMAKKISRNIITVMGGLFVSVHGSKVLSECPDLDYGLCGESDLSFPHLLDLLATGNRDKLNLVDGLIYRQQDGLVVTNPKIQFIDKLDDLPFPARDLVDIETYSKGGFKYQLFGLGFRPALSILTSRSCPMRCTFCNMKLVHGPRWRYRSVDNCVAELEEMIFKYGAQHVHIIDDNFTHSPDRAKEFCHEILRRNLKFRWNTANGISVKGMDKELAQLMKLSGCANVCVAIESGSEYVRHKLMNKKTMDREIIDAIDSFHSAGIPIVGLILLGMPGETVEENRRSIDFIKKLPITTVAVNFVFPFPGTKMFNDLVVAGKLIRENHSEMDDYRHVSIQNEGITEEQMLSWYEELRSSFPRLGILRELEERAELANFA